MINNYFLRLKNEFKDYNTSKLTKDFLAGITVAAVALPLALAFGVSSGADAGAGLITAIIAGIIIGGLGGASYQISGPTGAMSAILITLSASYGLQGVFVASFLAGIFLLICGLLKVGKLVSFIPSSVICGFTSGIAIIIATGQIDNFFGSTHQGSGVINQFVSYITKGFNINLYSIMFGLLVVMIMVFLPKKINAIIPGSLIGIIVALIINMIFKFDVTVVGKIPTTLLPQVRLNLFNIDFNNITNFVMPGISIAALGMIESLLCGASASKMKNETFDANQELVAQGIGNMVIPFFGGVPATAAIARTSVAIKAGGVTRLVSLFHSLALVASMFLLGSFMSKIPLAALAGVLMVTAYRMNEWSLIKEMFVKKSKTSLGQFFVTMIATVIFDLTVAIIIGVVLAMLLFVVRNSDLSVSVSDVDTDRIDDDLVHHHQDTKMVYVSGPMFFGTKDMLISKLREILEGDVNNLIISMRGVPSIDESAIEELKVIVERCKKRNVRVIFCGLQNQVLMSMHRYDLLDLIDDGDVTWDAISAIKLIDKSYL
ncbi:MAG: SulP family inorganic anion transporter [Thomasclavelia sp.]|nr:SulP family inorganic anion transporter [Thomasclavelia sp.]